VLLIVPKTQEIQDSKLGFVSRDFEEDRERITSINSTLNLLRTNSTLQQLVPNLSRFFYQQTKNFKKFGNHLYTLQVIVKAVDAMIANPHISLQFHLVQILPTLFSCIVSTQLGDESNDSHWSLRVYTAQVVAFACWRHRLIFPDLVARVVKTYMEALTADKSLTTVYGGVQGLLALLNTPSAQQIVSNELMSHLILSEMLQIHNRIESSLHRKDSLICMNGVLSVVGIMVSLGTTTLNRLRNYGVLTSASSVEKKRKRSDDSEAGGRGDGLLSNILDQFSEKLVPFTCKDKQISSVSNNRHVASLFLSSR
jgi:hypothetical protein